MKNCLVIGAAMLDIVMNIGELPKSGADVYASSQEMTVGGCAYNVADILKHFDVPYTLLAPTGNGPYGEIIATKLVWAGHKSPLMTSRGDNGYCLCLVESNGERTFITLPGVECCFESSWFDTIDVNQYDCAYICGYEVEGSSTIIEFCERNPHLSIYYAPSPRIMDIEMGVHERIFKLGPVLHLNKSEALSFTACTRVEDAARMLFQKTNNLVIVTLGCEGCYYHTDDDFGYVGGISATVVDTIGAGDSHIGAFIGSKMDGHDIIESLERANKVASSVVQSQGASLSASAFNEISF